MENWFKDVKVKVLSILFILFVLGLFMYPAFAGLLLIFSILVFGGLVLVWKESHVKIVGLAALVLLAIVNMGIHELQFGIDFSGGTRIPILLERSVDQETINELIQTIKKRISVLGLTEAKVYAIGNSEIDVEIPGDDPERVRFIQDTLSRQGVFRAVVDGRIALRGEDLFAASVTSVPASQLQPGSDWGVQFSIRQEGAEHFAEVTKGKGNQPLYMFLDRPSHAVVFVSWEQIQQNAPEESSRTALLQALNRSSYLEEDPIPIYILDEINLSNLPAGENVTAIISSDTSDRIKATLSEKGYVLRELDEETMIPSYSLISRNELVLDQWEAVGLLSMAILNPGVTQGLPIRSATITGSLAGADPSERAKLAEDNIKRIESILKGGSLPVQISLGSSTVVPPSLGQEFLRLSLVGVAAALVAISLFIGLRYKRPNIILPIIAISISELIILVSILGSFTIDLAAMAGIIAVIGVSVDAQIVITDELLKKTSSLKDRLGYAFRIIKTNVTVAIVAMLPLLFSGLVEIIGFAISTILGALLGFLLSRPAYAVLAERILGQEKD